MPIPADAFFYLHGPEFHDFRSAFCDFRHDGSAGLCYRDARFHVRREEEGFDSANFRMVGVAEFPDIPGDFDELFRKRRVRRRGDDSKIENFRNGVASFQYGETHGGRSRVDTEDY